MKENNFKKLEEERMGLFNSETAKRNIDGTTNSFRFMGNIVELFFSNVVNTLIEMFKGTDTKIEK